LPPVYRFESGTHLTDESERTFGPAHATELPWHKPMVITVTVVGPFEEEEEGSDVVNVEGEDPATPGLLPKLIPGP